MLYDAKEIIERMLDDPHFTKEMLEEMANSFEDGSMTDAVETGIVITHEFGKREWVKTFNQIRKSFDEIEKNYLPNV